MLYSESGGAEFSVSTVFIRFCLKAESPSLFLHDVLGSYVIVARKSDVLEILHIMAYYVVDIGGKHLRKEDVSRRCQVTVEIEV